MNVTSAQFVKDSEGKITVVKATIDGEEMFVPHNVTGNRHSAAVQAWVAEGNTIAEAD